MAIVFSACRTVSMLIKGNVVPYYKIFSFSLISTIVLPHIQLRPTPSRPFPLLHNRFLFACLAAADIVLQR